MFVSALGSSTTPAVNRIGHEPSSCWVARHHSYARRAAFSSPPSTKPIAASTWFHTSVCVPSLHGNAPSACCTRAMEAAVARTSAGDRGPSRAGMSADMGLAQVDDQALADQRVQRPFGQPGDPRPLHDVPDQQPVVRRHERVPVVVHTDRTLDPPVRRVEPVCMLAALEDQAGGLDLPDEVVTGVDPDMPALDIVVLAG